MLLFVGSVLSQENKVISGKVTDEKGNGLPNVTISVKGTSIGTTSKSDGTFSLTAPAYAKTLVFSSVGMTPMEVNIGNKDVFDVSLKPADREMQEVVVVGYGTQKRKEVTSSVATVRGQDIANKPVQSFDAALGGRAAGVQITVPNGVVNTPPVFRIRGTNSISLSSYPLIVIDGVPAFTGDLSSTSAAGNALSSINPSDIQSIDILKDAAATAIYGSRAANGVVLITTKRGRPGKAKVTYDGWVGFTRPYGLPDVLGADDYMTIKNEGLTNAGITTQKFLPTNGPDGKPINTNWNDYVYRNPVSHSHAISVSGGSEGTTYYFSAGYTDQEGILQKNSFIRKNLRFSVDNKTNKILSLGGTFGYSNEQNNASGTSGSLTGEAFNTAGLGRLAFVTAPNVGPYLNDGTYNLLGNNIGIMNNTVPQVGFYNPVAILDNNRSNSENNHIQGNVYVQLKPVSWMTLRSVYGVDFANVDNEIYQSPIHGDGYPSGNASSTLNKLKRTTWSNTAQFDYTFKDKHSFSLLGGMEQQRSTQDGFGLNRQNISDPYYTNIQGGWTTNNATGLAIGENYLNSLFGRLNYDFSKKYFLSGNVRRDEYSAFAPGHKAGTFWGASAGWDIARENFWGSLSDVISDFKIRGSYGTVGNIGGIDNFASYSLYGSGLYNGAPTFTFSQAGNANLKWETSKKTDVGFSFGLFKNILSGEVAFYKNNIDGLIYNVPQAPSRGLPGNALLMNVGSMYNKGVEVTLNANPVTKKDFSWTTSFNITFNKNEVTSLVPELGITEFTSSTSSLETVNITRVGYPLGSLYVVKTAGVDPQTGRRIFINKAGQQVRYQQVVPAGQSKWTFMDGTTAPAVGGADAVLYANSDPKIYGGFDNTFRYKNFDFNLLFTYQANFFVYYGSQAGLRDQRFWNNEKDVMRRWQKVGDVTDIPRVVNGDNVSNGSAFPLDINVSKGDFIKLRSLTLGYTLSPRILERAHISNLRMYVSGQNLAIFTKYPGPDPEVSSNGNGNTNQGVDRNTIGNGRVITIGMGLGF
jgi:TonB-linked SusC/RagA family outer membrane protein